MSFFALLRNARLLCFGSCLAHVINLGTQVLISTYSKAPHYARHDLQAHEPNATQNSNRDEIRLVCSIFVKVCLALVQEVHFIEYFQRNAHPPNERSFTSKFRSRPLSRTPHSYFLI